MSLHVDDVAEEDFMFKGCEGGDEKDDSGLDVETVPGTSDEAHLGEYDPYEVFPFSGNEENSSPELKALEREDIERIFREKASSNHQHRIPSPPPRISAKREYTQDEVVDLISSYSKEKDAKHSLQLLRVDMDTDFQNNLWRIVQQLYSTTKFNTDGTLKYGEFRASVGLGSANPSPSETESSFFSSSSPPTSAIPKNLPFINPLIINRKQDQQQHHHFRFCSNTGSFNTTTGSGSARQVLDGGGPLFRSSQTSLYSPIGGDKKMLSKMFQPRVNLLQPLPHNSCPMFDILEQHATQHRSAAGVCKPTVAWSGSLTKINYENPVHSPMVFVGGVPWDITMTSLASTFAPYGLVHIELPTPVKHPKHWNCPLKAGYVYLLLKDDKAVRELLLNCNCDVITQKSFFCLSSARMQNKEVQIIPWILSDNNVTLKPTVRVEVSKTVFVGNLHGTMTATNLANIMNDLFQDVVYCGIDTDKNQYPIGSGRVAFSSAHSYNKALQAAFIEVRTAKFTKKLQIDPYFEDSECNSCKLKKGRYFCKFPGCFKYYCQLCWAYQHSIGDLQFHRPLMRKQKNRSIIPDTNFGLHF